MYYKLCANWSLENYCVLSSSLHSDTYVCYLKNILSAKNLSQYLVLADVITFQDEEEICEANTSSDKATILLLRLVGPLKSRNTFGFHQLLQVMEAHGNSATKDVANKMKKAVSSL